MSTAESPAPHLWTPGPPVGRVQHEGQILVERGEGCYVRTADGRRLYDGTSALWYANLGHAHPELVAAAARQLGVLETFHVWAGYLNRPAAELSTRLVERHAPFPDAKVMFASGGSDAAEIAFRLARRHWQLAGLPGKTMILSRGSAYHGLHAFGTSLHGAAAVRDAWGGGGLVGDTDRIDRDDIGAVRGEIERIGPERIAAIVAEPIVGSGGVHPPRPGYLRGLRDLCDRHGILLIFDEVITGFGRTGHWFASDRYGVAPDMTMFAKGITCGYVPLGGVFVSPPIWEPFFRPDGDEAYVFGVTYAGHATACAVGMTVLDIIERDGLLGRVAELEALLMPRVASLAGLAAVREVRGEGLMAAVELDDATTAQRVVAAMRERHGVIVRVAAGTSVAMSPPFVSTDDEVDGMVSALGEVLAELPG